MAFTRHAFRHDSLPLTGVLLTNLGTPAAPTSVALRRYLAEFLWDPRVVELPRPLWWLILHGVILRTRPRHSAHAYAKIWNEQGSPLLSISQAQAAALQEALTKQMPGPVQVALGMRYGQPSIAQALEELRQAGVRRLVVLPLYPQYASATTGSTWDAVSRVLSRWRWLPELRFITHYHDFPGYIAALSESAKSHWGKYGQPDKLIFSFHGIPKRTFLAGDPYFCECHKTARLVAESLELPENAWQVVFQSRFGREEWLQPYADKTLEALGKAKTRRVGVICPGFAADCLETLEEMAQTNKALFFKAGGQEFHYIPALNDRPAHIKALAQLVKQHIKGWDESKADSLRQSAEQCSQRALALGAKE
jgi:ferrochelatase